MDKVIKNIQAAKILFGTNLEVEQMKTDHNVERVTKILCNQWSFDESVIRQVVTALEGSFDESDSYLDIMDSEGTTEPETEYIWEMFCDRHSMNVANPF